MLVSAYKDQSLLTKKQTSEIGTEKRKGKLTADFSKPINESNVHQSLLAGSFLKGGKTLVFGESFLSSARWSVSEFSAKFRRILRQQGANGARARIHRSISIGGFNSSARFFHPVPWDVASSEITRSTGRLPLVGEKPSSDLRQGQKEKKEMHGTWRKRRIKDRSGGSNRVVGC